MSNISGALMTPYDLHGHRRTAMLPLELCCQAGSGPCQELNPTYNAQRYGRHYFANVRKSLFCYFQHFVIRSFSLGHTAVMVSCLMFDRRTDTWTSHLQCQCSLLDNLCNTVTVCKWPQTFNLILKKLTNTPTSQKHTMSQSEAAKQAPPLHTIRCDVFMLHLIVIVHH